MNFFFKPAHPARRDGLIAAILYALLTLVVFGPVLFAGGSTVLSSADADLASQYVPWRAFGFGEMARGNLPLWNPHIYSGAPFFTGFQSALLYPLNWIFLLLPLAAAINWSIALHVFLAGVFMRAWAVGRGLSARASFLCGVLLMLCAPHFLHVYAGHLSNLCVVPWVPLLFLAIDGWLRTREPGWCALGMAAVALQVFAGNPQYIFCAGIAAVLYSLLSLWRTERPLHGLAGLAATALGGVALSAVQLVPGLLATGDSLRGGGVSREFAALFSFPPENVLTLVAPDFFGHLPGGVYWGRGYLWEMSLFFGASGQFLASVGIARGRSPGRWVCLTVAAALFVLALGSYTPLFGLLYGHAPGFNSFRGWSKFSFPGELFLILLAGEGLDALSASPPKTLARCAAAAGGAALLLGLAAASIALLAGSAAWAHAMGSLAGAQDAYLPAAQYADPGFVRQAAAAAARSLLPGGVALALLAAAIFRLRRDARWSYGIVALAVVELVVFARGSVDSFDLQTVLPGPFAASLAGAPPGARTLNVISPDNGMVLGRSDIWGYDALSVTRRYGEFVAVSQGLTPDRVSPEIPFRSYSPLLALLRCRYAIMPTSDTDVNLQDFGNGLPRFVLVPGYKRLTDRDAIFAELQRPGFDPRREVILESQPDPEPVASADPGAVRLVAASTDELTLEADVKAPSILLVTDNYNRDWHALALAGSVQRRYDLLPADYTLQAVPLRAGHHHFRLRYVPTGFVAGAWTTVVSLVLFAGALLWRAVRPSR